MGHLNFIGPAIQVERLIPAAGIRDHAPGGAHINADYFYRGSLDNTAGGIVNQSFEDSRGLCRESCIENREQKQEAEDE
jgi:hypothetical protein